MFPENRPRRTRRTENLRNLVSETSILREKLIMPVFVDENIKEPKEIQSMPGIFSYPLSELDSYARHLKNIGIRNVLLFGIPESKDGEGSQAYDENGIVQKAIPYFRKNDLLVITDLCMCEYTDHGHCGIVVNGDVDNDATISYYGKIAVSQASAGADMIAPSGMMDGQVAEIRRSLDQAGFNHIPVMAYSAKYASSLYGPFRDAAQSTPSFGNRKTYQMDPANVREAMREIEEDILEGADLIMVKPALFYLDVVREARQRFDLPLVSYGVSGEYSLIMNGIRQKLIAESAIDEYLTSIFRAGADMVITYFAQYLCERTQDGKNNPE
ncbi:MAG: porphobilinogen synthase [Candidatus Thermoplasmatota archaeon]|nr:porphobilinogen synthase [Candidatus Thermoplasmatota archaeon]